MAYNPTPNLAFSYTARTTTYTAVANNFVDCTSGTFTVTLPTAVGVSGQTITVLNSGSGVITLNTTSSQTIFVGSALASGVIKMGKPGDKVILVSNGTNWLAAEFDVHVGARADTSTTTVTGTVATMIFTNVVSGDNPQGDYSTGTGLYTCSIPGLYQAAGAIYADVTSAADDLVQTYIYKNAGVAVEWVQRMSGDRSNISFPISGRVRLAAGDTASLRFNMAGTSPSHTSSRDYFEITRIGN